MIIPAHNGFACIEDLRDRRWDEGVRALAMRDLGELKIEGWTRHWSRIWEFPWAYSAIRANFAHDSHPKVLESGCGVTPVPFWLAADGFAVTGIDLDTDCEASWRSPDVPCRPDPSTTSFERDDMLNIHWESGTADLVFSISAVEHTTDPVRAVSEMLRVLRPGGGLVLTMDVDICGSDSVGWEPFCEIVTLLESCTKSLLPVRHVVSSRLLTFENRTLQPQSSTRLLSKRILDHFGLKRRSDQTVFAWAGEKLRPECAG